MARMAASTLIAARFTTETRDVRRLAVDQGVTESVLLKRLVELALSSGRLNGAQGSGQQARKVGAAPHVAPSALRSVPSAGT
jgi:hypothetical protein